jgi:hypothetical protein
MPELAQVIRLLIIEIIFEGSVAMPQLLKEFVLRAHGIEVEGFAGREDDNLLREVAVVGVIQAVYTPISILSSCIRNL